MAQWHGYFGVERLTIPDDAQWNAIKARLAAILIDNPGGPHEALQIKLRSDGDAAITEGLFTLDDITVEAFTTMLSNATGVPVENITHSSNVVTLSVIPTRVHTFSTSGTARLRAVLFGVSNGAACTWDESRVECAQYLENNNEVWQPAGAP